VQLTGDPDDSVGDVRKKQVRQEERAKGVRRGLQVQMILGAGQGNIHDSGVVDQDVESPGPAPGECANTGEVRDVEQAHFDVACHRRGGGLSFREVANSEDYVRCRSCELTGSDEPYAARCASYHYCPARHLWHVYRCPFGHVESPSSVTIRLAAGIS
jgi:hypothetical protein